jgi:gluconate 2-dehydrogenase gamma chain
MQNAGDTMDHDEHDRRDFLKSVASGGAAAAATVLPTTTLAQAPRPAASATTVPVPEAVGYTYFTPDEAAFIEAVVDHMIPADALTPKGTDLGVNVYIDRALASGWGKGERLYRQGPWKQGSGNQGYQLPLTPAEVYRAAIPAANAQCVKLHGKPFEKLAAEQREAFLLALQAGKVTLEGGPPAGTFFDMLYQNVMEGMFSDPVYGGNKDKAGWKLVGFGGVVAVHQQNVVKYLGKKFPIQALGIADMS